MAFFLATNGQLHPYNFRYLDGDFEKARLERTEIHATSKINESKSKALPDHQKEFYAIDIMTKPIHTMAVDSLLKDVKNLMKTYDIRHVPIVKDRHIVGMISDRDLLKVGMSGTFPFLKAANIMSTVLIVALDETPLAHVARVLMEEKISCLPVIDSNQLLVGMISRTDILRAVVYNRLVLK